MGEILSEASPLANDIAKEVATVCEGLSSEDKALLTGIAELLQSRVQSKS